MALTKPQNSHTSQSATGDILQPITGQGWGREKGVPLLIPLPRQYASMNLGGRIFRER